MLQDMLLQSWGENIRVFEGVPGKWKDAVFQNLRAEGAFLVSAVRKNGNTSWIKVESLAGEPCRIISDFGGRKPSVKADRKMKLTEVKSGIWSLDIRKGESALLYAGDECPDLTVAPLPMKPEDMNMYGLDASRPLPIYDPRKKKFR